MKNILILVFTFVTLSMTSQVGIGTTTPNLSSLLDINSIDKGVLFPRVSLVQTTNFVPLLSHVAGMQVYNTATVNDVIPGQYYNDGTKWIKIADANATKRNYTFLKTSDGLPAETVGDNLVNAFRQGHTAFGNATNNPDNFFLYGGLPLKAIASFQEKLNLNSQYSDVTDGIVSALEHDAPTSASLGSQGSRAGNFLNHTKASSTVNYNYLAAMAGDASHFGTGTVNFLQGLSEGAFNNGSGNITNAEGIRATIRNFGTGSITNATALNVDITNNLGASPVTNAYGLYINDIQATNPFAIYQLGNNNKNYFAGNVGVKTTIPSEALEVVGNIKLSGALMPNNLAGTSGQVLISSGVGVAPTWSSNPGKSFVTTGITVGIYSVSLLDYTIRVFNTVSEIRLPNAVGNKDKVFIVIGSNGISTKVWSTFGGVIYDDVTNVTYNTINANQRFMVQSDGTDWIVIGR